VAKTTPQIEKQEIHCHECQMYVRFELDMAMNGNHVLNCPNCGHEHCRVVKNGKITDVRWDQRNGPTYNVSQYTITYTATTATTSDYFIYDAWTMTA
jgi:hypothetical protein